MANGQTVILNAYQVDIAIARYIEQYQLGSGDPGRYEITIEFDGEGSDLMAKVLLIKLKAPTKVGRLVMPSESAGPNWVHYMLVSLAVLMFFVGLWMPK